MVPELTFSLIFFSSAISERQSAAETTETAETAKAEKQKSRKK
jgi:hypothetical protein